MKVVDKVNIKVNAKLSLWSALKLRLSGLTSIEKRVGNISSKYRLNEKQKETLKKRDLHKFINTMNLIKDGMSLNNETHAIKIIDILHEYSPIDIDKLYEFEKNLLFMELSGLSDSLIHIDRVSFEIAATEYFKIQGKEIIKIKKNKKK